MALGEPRDRFVPIPCTGALEESVSPLRIGGSGLTDCVNLAYERTGGWGKRSGSAIQYTSQGSGGFANPKSTGVRWYRTSPTELTQTIVSAMGALWIANDSTGVLTKLYDFKANPTKRIRFASVYDPAAHLGSGGDILIICGATTDEGFATGTYQITGIMGGNPSLKILITINGFAVPDINGSSAQTYKPLQTDNPFTIATALAAQINSSKLVQPDPTHSTTPILGQAYVTQTTDPSTNTVTAVLHIGALVSGTGGNGVAYSVSTTGSSGTSPTGTLAIAAIGSPMSGGGEQTDAPLKYDGATVSGLSYQIQHGFRNCCTWHEHVWYWDDPNFQNSLFASDIDQPEGFTFMAQNGGYKIGLGDGDPSIQVAKPWGNSLAVFKTNNIYQITGYDFQSGEYIFQVQPLITADENAGGSGVPAPDCVAELSDALVYWDGRGFFRLAVGAFVPEHIGAPIPLSSAAVRTGKQTLVQAVAGNFTELTTLNNQYFDTLPAIECMRMSRAYWAYDSNNDGVPDSILMYDDDATQRLGKYAWTKWTGLSVASWIPFGNGPNASGSDSDKPYLLFLQYNGSGLPTVVRLGGNASFDQGSPIPWMAQTGYDPARSPNLTKNLHRIFIEIQANAGAQIDASILPCQTNLQGQYIGGPVPLAFPAATAQGSEAYNEILATIEPQLKNPAFMFQFSEDGIAGAQFELLTYNLDVIEETLMP